MKPPLTCPLNVKTTIYMEKPILAVFLRFRRPPGEDFRPDFRTCSSFRDVQPDPGQPPVAAAEAAAATASTLPAADEETSTQAFKKGQQGYYDQQLASRLLAAQSKLHIRFSMNEGPRKRPNVAFFQEKRPKRQMKKTNLNT